MTSGAFHSRRVSLGVPVIDQISKAIKKGDEEAFRQLISLFRFNETSSNLNQLDSDGSHPLHLAVKYRRMKMLRTMLHYKNSLNLDVCITDFDGLSAIEVAIMNKNHQALHKLVKHGASAGLAVPFEELRLQLLECPPRTDHREVRNTHWRSDVCEVAVQRCYYDLTKYMDPSLILPILVFAGHLSLECAERIISYQTKREQTMQLLCLLRTSSRNGCQGLFKALKEEKEHKAHQELLEQLENSCEIILMQRTKTGLSSRESSWCVVM